MEPLYVHLAIWLFPVSKPNIQIQIETPFGKWQFHGSFSKYCELCEEETLQRKFGIQPDLFKDSFQLFRRLLLFHIGICCSVYDCWRNRQKEMGQNIVGIEKKSAGQIYRNTLYYRAQQALHRTCCCLLFPPVCNPRSSTERRDVASIWSNKSV